MTETTLVKLSMVAATSFIFALAGAYLETNKLIKEPVDWFLFGTAHGALIMGVMIDGA